MPSFKSEKNRLIVYVILLAFGLNTVSPVSLGYGQTPAVDGAGTPLILPNPGAMVGLSPPFVPVILRGLKVHPDNPFQFDFIVDTGTTGLDVGNGLKPFLTEESTWRR